MAEERSTEAGASKPPTYRDAGVDIDAGNRAVELMRDYVRSTYRPEVMGDIGGFGGLFRVPAGRGSDAPVLVGATDGVGTKLKLAFLTGIHDTVGIDCVAMNVNDVVTTGAEPLFFLDYLGTGKVEPNTVADIVKGVAEGCRQAGCALIGGETAELPDLYAPGEYDLAGFVVGLVGADKIIDGSGVQEGMAVIGLRSSGLHSNGFTLVRRALLDRAGLSVDGYVDELGCTLGEELLRPTRIYVKDLLELIGRFGIHGAAHVTGGGLLENIPRILPAGLGVVLERDTWTPQPIFEVVRRAGGIEEPELWRTFNMGIGMVLIVDSRDADTIQNELLDWGTESARIGMVVEHTTGPRVILD